MELKNLSFDQLKGYAIGWFGPMNGGKTRELVTELKRGEQAHLIVKAYLPSKTEREKNALVINNKEPYPARSIEKISEIKKDLESLIKKEEIVIGIDEINLFCLNEKETKELIDFIHWSKENQIVLYVAGLLYDFRQRPFGEVFSILPYLDIKYECSVRPVCKAWSSDRTKGKPKPCGKPAFHTQRVWAKEYAKKEGLFEDLINQAGYFDFFDKENHLWEKEYLPAPFFDKTICTKEDKDLAEGKKTIAYLPVCHRCARLPFKEEVFRIYKEIFQQNDLIKQTPLTRKILQFLLAEGWVKEIKGKYENHLSVSPFYPNELGSYTRTI